MQTPNKAKTKEWTFDAVFGPETSQETVYNEVEPLVGFIPVFIDSTCDVDKKCNRWL